MAFGTALAWLAPANRRGLQAWKGTISTPRRGTQRKELRCRSASASANGGAIRLSPSDFAFQWEECQRCFYMKSHGVLQRPRMPFPSIFGKIDLEMKRYFRGRRTEDLLQHGDLPPGEFLCEDNDATVESTPIDTASGLSVYIRGKIDCLVGLDDGTHAVIDFKTSRIDRYLSKYSRQLHAYALALENPSDKSELDQLTISRLGLVVYEPTLFSMNTAKEPHAALGGNLSYVEIPRDDDAFMEFLNRVGKVLSSRAPVAPPAGRNGCPYCNYVAEAIAVSAN